MASPRLKKKCMDDIDTNNCVCLSTQGFNILPENLSIFLPEKIEKTYKASRYSRSVETHILPAGEKPDRITPLLMVKYIHESTIFLLYLLPFNQSSLEVTTLFR